MRLISSCDLVTREPVTWLARGCVAGLCSLAFAVACDNAPERGAVMTQQAQTSSCAPRRMLDPRDYGEVVEQVVEAVALGNGLPRALKAQREALSQASPEVFEMDGMTRVPMEDFDKSHRFVMHVEAPVFGGETAEVVVTLSTSNKGLRRDYGNRWIPDVHQVLDITAQWAPRDRVREDERVSVVMSFYREVVPAEQNPKLAVTAGYFALLVVDILVPFRIDREVPDEHHSALEQLRQSFNRAMQDSEFDAWRSAPMTTESKDMTFDAPPWGYFVLTPNRATARSLLSRYAFNSTTNLRFYSSHEFLPMGGRFDYLRVVDGASKPGQWIEGVFYLEDVSRSFQDVEVIDVEFIGESVTVTLTQRPDSD
jgi:hypothetical protein